MRRLSRLMQAVTQWTFVAPLLVGLCAAQDPQPTAAPARVFGDHMVLQRDRPIPVWGTAPAGSLVAVTLGDSVARGRANELGQFEVTLPAMTANPTPQSLVIRGEGEDETRIEDVLIGDVWLCSGQSNMAFGLHGCDAPDDIAAADDSLVRYRSYWEEFAAEPRADVSGGEWRVLSPGSAGDCTAVGFYFARRVREDVDVPVGVLTCAVGGTEIECWMAPEAVRDVPANAEVGVRLDAALAAHQERLRTALPAVEAWAAAAREAADRGHRLPSPPSLPPHPNEDRMNWHRTHSLFHGMVHPLLRFPVRGVLWYQGENNGHEEQSYADKFRAMVATWRRRMGADVPFYWAQLTSFGEPTDDPSGGHGWQSCRMAQLACLDLPASGMAVTFDVGDALDIHPKNKRDVGERLARWALARDYGVDLEPSGPLFRSIAVEGNAIRVHFDHASSGMMAGQASGAPPPDTGPVARLRGFAIAGRDRRFFWAEASIQGDTILVRSPEVPDPIAVRYAFAQNPTGANLYGANGLPASPFRSDSW
jgi:sialate O-acetylesterase